MLTATVFLAAALQPPPAKPAQVAPASRFHLVRATSGSRGSQEGQRFLIEDPRSVFHAGQDRQVLVLFEWRGPLGPHRCEATWKDPSGKAVLTSRSELVARGPRFGAYWGLSLPDAVATGTWLIEALVDGEPAGAHAFQIVAGAADPGAPPPRRALGVSELYQRALAATLTVTAMDASGRSLSTSSGLLLTPELVLVPFLSLNMARTARVRLPDGRQLGTNVILAFDRKGDWGLLRLGEPAGQPLARAEMAPGVGDAGYLVALQGDGSRVIVETSFVGRSASNDLLIPAHVDLGSAGGPVLNEFGEVVGFVVADHVFLGAGRLDLLPLGALHPSTGGTRVRSLPAVPDAAAATRTLADLELAGEFVRPLAATRHFVSGVLGTGIAEDRGVPFAVGQKFRFSRTEARLVVFVTWAGRQKQEATAEIVLFDESNLALFKSPSNQLKLRPGRTLVQWWPVELARLQAGVYRVDAVLNGDPLWRTFFALTD